MLVNFLIMILRIKPDPMAPLGRWGHHWEKRMRYQKYYE